jgi:AraC-like DNA-binding protein
MRSEKTEVQYRYYEMSPNSPILALLGSGWHRTYGVVTDPLHFHNYLEIGYCYDGSGRMIFTESEKRYQSGSFSFIPARFLHNTVADGQAKNRWEYLFVDTESFLCAVYENEPQKAKQIVSLVNMAPHVLSNNEHQELESCILQIMDLYRDKSHLYIDCAKGLLLSMLIRVASLSQSCLSTELTSQTSVIAKALRYVCENYMKDIRVSDVAAACHMSETHFRRLFAKGMRMSPHNYINLVRVEAACKLMRTTSNDLQDIAQNCGFITVQSFDRNFKAMMGILPSKWRKETDYFRKQFENQHIVVFNGWK